MNADKREIILNEIEYWRRNRLLPEQYCDFLTNLYDDKEAAARRNPLSLENLQQGSIKVWLLCFGVISFIFLIAFYFSVFPWGLQLAVAVSTLIVVYGYAGVLRKRQPLTSLMLAGTGSVLMLGFGVWLISLHDLNRGLWLPILVTLCGIVWAVLGMLLRIGLLQYCGFGAMLLLYAGFFIQIRPDASVWELQLFWLPLCVLMIWLSWLLHHKTQGMSSVYFAVGATIWMMPEIDSMLLRDTAPGWIALVIIVKLAAAGGLLFGFRKKWITWVAS